MEFDGGTHKSTERPRSLKTPSRTMESMCPRMSCAQKGQRGPQCCTHCTKQLKWRRFRQHGRIRESPSFCSKVHIVQQLMASETSEHNSSPQKRHNWSDPDNWGVQQRHSTETTTRQNHTGTRGKRDHLPPRDQQGQHQEVDLPTCCCDEEEFHLHTTQIAGAIASEAHWDLPWHDHESQLKNTLEPERA